MNYNDSGLRQTICMLSSRVDRICEQLQNLNTSNVKLQRQDFEFYDKCLKLKQEKLAIQREQLQALKDLNATWRDIFEYNMGAKQFQDFQKNEKDEDKNGDIKPLQ